MISLNGSKSRILFAKCVCILAAELPEEEKGEGEKEGDGAYGVVPCVWEVEAYFGNAEIGSADSGHEGGGKERQQVGCRAIRFGLHKIGRGGPEHEDCEGLVCPTEIAPDDIEAVLVCDVVPE